MKILLAGDLHGNRHDARRAVQYALDNECDRVFVLGDFGIWEPNDNSGFLKLFDLMGEETGIDTYFLDGNHENFDFLYSFAVADDGLRYINNHLVHVPRGTILDLDGKYVMVMGGATSIDYQYRVAGKSWWPEESITFQDMTEAEDNLGRLRHNSPAAIDISAVFSHDAPELPATSNKALEQYLPSIDRVASQNNRNWIKALIEITQTPRLYHGHHHTRYSSVYNDTQIEGLACDGHKIVDSLLVVDTDDWE